ncbi:MAG: PEP-CTERM/exosortase system-associated acyltransferase [Deferrisomatales bacterium]|nr:PEP-CTERM/exosortase system-associated acyltransferase [Deferrisomatales bacterium]
MPSSDLLAHFDREFELIYRIDPRVMDDIHRLRYDVLCDQVGLVGFEPWRYPDQREKDGYDRRSVFCAMYHRASGRIAGCVRLILSDPRNVNEPFAVEEAARNYFDEEFDAGTLPRHRTAEISRFLVAKEHMPGQGGTREARRQFRATGFPFPMLGLLQGIIQLAAKHDAVYTYAIMEPVLNRLLRRFAVNFPAIGPVIEHHGKRQAYFAELAEVVDRAKGVRREVWDLMTRRGSVLPPRMVPVEARELGAVALMA